MSTLELPSSQNPNIPDPLQEAFRKAFFIGHVFPIDPDLHPDTPSYAQNLELQMVAAGLPQADIDKARRQGGLEAVDEYDRYLEGGMKALTFDEDFKNHLIHRILEAHQMQREVVLPSPRTSTR